VIAGQGERADLQKRGAGRTNLCADDGRRHNTTAALAEDHHAFTNFFNRNVPVGRGNHGSGRNAFVDGPVGMGRDGLGVVLRRAPEVGDVAVEVVDRLNPGRVGAGQQERGRPAEGFNRVVHVPQTPPDERRDFRLAAEPGERGLESLLFHAITPVNAGHGAVIAGTARPLIP
jgi:hypothetical protein